MVDIYSVLLTVVEEKMGSCFVTFVVPLLVLALGMNEEATVALR